MNDKQMRVAAAVMFVTAAFVITFAAILPGKPMIAPKTKAPVPGLPCPPNCAPMLFASPAMKPHLPIPVPSPASVAAIRMR